MKKVSVCRPLAVLMPILCAARAPRLTVLIFHRVLQSHDFMRPWEVTAAEFSWQMEVISRYFRPLSLTNAIQHLKQGDLPEKSVCVTFDDGYADNYEIALPILKRWNIPATIFIATGFLDGGRMWNDSVLEALRTVPSAELDLREMDFDVYPLLTQSDRLRAANNILLKLKYLPQERRKEVTGYIASFAKKLPDDLMMTTDQVKNIFSQGIEIGAHTETHPILSRLTTESAQREIVVGKETLENIIGEKLRFFAYPNGNPGKDYTRQHVEMLPSLGFDAAVSTRWGVSNGNSDIWQLPRFTPWDKTPIKFMARLIRNYWDLVLPEDSSIDY